MLPSFITSYIDNKGYIHLYFYPGLDDDLDNIYENVKLETGNIKYIEIPHVDGSVEFKLLNKNIIKFHCKLINKKTKEIEYKNINVKKN